MFVAIGPNATEPAGDAIASGAFWPAISPADFRLAMRADSAITANRVRGALIEAIAAVNGQLAPWRLQQQAGGSATLAAVPAEVVDGQSEKVQRYVRAVYCIAKANLVERYRDYDLTHTGKDKAEELDEPIDDLRRDAAWAVADIQQRPRCTVELV